jgi:hypothetical protein
MTHPSGTESGYRRTPLSAEENLRAEANFVPYVVQMLAASGRFRVSADTPDQVELFQAVARRVSELLKQPVVSYANGREIVITFGRQRPPASLAEAPSQHRSDRPAGADRGGSARLRRSCRECRIWATVTNAAPQTRVTAR